MPSMVYEWKPNTRIPVPAQAAGEEVEHLRKQCNGLLTPAFVVDAARGKDSVLHAAFEWDDGVAAEKHREDQARGLIRALVVTVRPQGVERSVRAFVSVTRAPDPAAEAAGETGYTSLPVMLSDADLRKQVLDRAWRELEQWRERYENYAEVVAWFEAAEAAKVA